MVSVNLEFSDEVHEQLLAEAEIHGLSLDQYLIRRLVPPSLGLDRSHDTDAGDAPEDPLESIQVAYRSSMPIVHQRMFEVQMDLLLLQRQVVQRSLETVAALGLTGEHHFYIAFHTKAPGVQIGEELVASHPETMTIVLEEQFGSLEVDDEGFSVNLWFSGVPRRLAIPFDALLAFIDPSTQFQLTFPTQATQAEEEAAADSDPLPVDGPNSDELSTAELAIAELETAEIDTGESIGNAPAAAIPALATEPAVTQHDAQADGVEETGTRQPSDGDAETSPEAIVDDEATAEIPSSTDNVLSFASFRKK